MISCPEEVAFRLGYIDVKRLRRLAEAIPNAYGEYLLRLSREPMGGKKP